MSADPYDIELAVHAAADRYGVMRVLEHYREQAEASGDFALWERHSALLTDEYRTDMQDRALPADATVAADRLRLVQLAGVGAASRDLPIDRVGLLAHRIPPSAAQALHDEAMKRMPVEDGDALIGVLGPLAIRLQVAYARIGSLVAADLRSTTGVAARTRSILRAAGVVDLMSGGQQPLPPSPRPTASQGWTRSPRSGFNPK